MASKKAPHQAGLFFDPASFPVCGHRKYHLVVIERDGRKPYVTDFYTCGLCSVMFLDPEAFTASKHNPLDTFPDVQLGWRERLARADAEKGKT